MFSCEQRTAAQISRLCRLKPLPSAECLWETHAGRFAPFLRLAFRSVTSGLPPLFAAIPILDALHAFTVWLSVWHMSWTTARFRLPTFSGLRILVQPVPCGARLRLCTASWCPQPSMLRALLPLWPWLLQSSPCGASAFPLCRNLPNRCPAFSLVFLTAYLDGTARSVPARR